MAGGGKAAGGDLVHGQRQGTQRYLSLCQFGPAHQLKILIPQHLLLRIGKPRIDLYFVLGLVFGGLRRVLGKGLGHPCGTGRWRLVRPVDLQLRQQHRGHPFQKFRVAPKNVKRLIEDFDLLVAGDKHGVERPIKIVAPAQAHLGDSGDGIEHRAGARRHPGGAQHPAKIHDVLANASAILGVSAFLGASAWLGSLHQRFAAAISLRTSASSRAASLP